MVGKPGNPKCGDRHDNSAQCCVLLGCSTRPVGWDDGATSTRSTVDEIYVLKYNLFFYPSKLLQYTFDIL